MGKTGAVACTNTFSNPFLIRVFHPCSPIPRYEGLTIRIIEYNALNVASSVDNVDSAASVPFFSAHKKDPTRGLFCAVLS